MKNKYLFLLAFMSSLLFSCQPKSLPSIMSAEENHIIFKVSHETTQSEVDEFAKKLLKMRIVLDLTGTTYFENGTMQNLKMAVLFPDGTMGTAAADIVGLQYRYYGFEYNPSGTTKFKTGSFE